jgi:hypothetical protein
MKILALIAAFALTAAAVAAAPSVTATLKLETAEGGDAKITFTGKLKDDGTLAGYLSSQMGDMKWTATRLPEQKKDGK